MNAYMPQFGERHVKDPEVSGNLTMIDPKNMVRGDETLSSSSSSLR